MLPLNRTRAPPAGAGAVSVTVPEVDDSPRILVLASVNADRLAGGVGVPAGRKVSPAKGARYPSKAVPLSMTTRVETETGDVGMLKVAPVPPAGIKTFAGGLIDAVSLLIKVTSTPPGGAGLSSVSVPTKEVPP